MPTTYNATTQAYLNRANAGRTIWLKGQRSEQYLEDPAGAVIYPGMIGQIYSNGGVRSIQPHPVKGGKTPFNIVLEDNLQGNTIDTPYSIGDLVRYVTAEPGTEVKVVIPAGCPSLTFGDALISNGDGSLTKLVGSATLYNSTAASTTITNTSTETVFDQNYTIPANTLQVGDVIVLRGSGTVTGVTGTPTLTIKLKIGSTVIENSGAITVTTNDSFFVEAFLTVRSVGASGTFVASGIVNVGTPNSATTKSFNLGSTTIDTTTGQLVSITATWSAASASNIVRQDILTVSRNNVGPGGTGVTPLAVCTNPVDNSAGVTTAFCDVMVF